MKKYIIDYMSTYDDLEHCWVFASCKKEAESEARREFGDIKQIIRIYEKS